MNFELMYSRLKWTANLGMCALISVNVLGCALHDRVTSVNDTFLEDVNIRSKLDTLPYDHSWVRSGFNGKIYNKLYVKPIRTDFLPDNEWQRSASPFINSKDDYQRQAKEVAAYFKASLEQKIRSYEGNRLTLVDRPGSDVLTLELALTELEFSHPVARAAALAAPVPGTGPALSTMSDPHAAFAARMTDGSGRLVATAADRKFPPTRIVDLNKLTVMSSAREICSLWADTLSEALNKGRFVETEGNSRFSILPW